MGAKVQFLPETRIIQITTAPVLVDGEMVVDIDVKTDLYSDGKEDWVTTDGLISYPFPLRSVGGDPLPGSKKLGSTFFLAEGWKIKPYNADQVLNINGNLYREDGKSPYTVTDDSHTVGIISTVSSLVDSTVQQLAEIEYGTFQNAVWVDLVDGDPISSGIELIGNRQHPVNSIADAITIANNRGFSLLQLLSDVTISTAIDLSDFQLVSSSHINTQLVVAANPNMNNVKIESVDLSGELDGGNEVWHSVIRDLTYFNGHIHDCSLAGTVTLDGVVESYISNCSMLENETIPIVDFNNDNNHLVMPEYSGIIKIAHFTHATANAMIGLNQGKIILDTATVTSGFITASGIGTMEDELGNDIQTGTWNGVTIVNMLISNSSIAKEVMSFEGF